MQVDKIPAPLRQYNEWIESTYDADVAKMNPIGSYSKYGMGYTNIQNVYVHSSENNVVTPSNTWKKAFLTKIEKSIRFVMDCIIKLNAITINLFPLL